MVCCFSSLMLSRVVLKQILADQRSAILKKDFGIPRTILQSLERKTKLPHVVAITGIRRCGKSTLLRQIIRTYYHDQDFYYLTFEDERLFGFQARDFNEVYEVMVEIFGESKTFFLDEVQNVPHFELFVRRFMENGFKFYITGSNADLLGQELGTKLTGRHIDAVLKPFSFAEILKLREVRLDGPEAYQTTTKALVKKVLDEYLQTGGMPEYLLFGEQEILHRLYEDILLKDIAVRHNITNVHQLREMSQYLVTNMANLFSYNALKNLLQFGSVTTVKKYVSFLEETYFALVVHKFVFSLKKRQMTPKKFYLMDHGFFPLVSPKVTKDYGRVLENIVAVTLSYHYDLNYYSGRQECDLVVRGHNNVVGVIQVTWELTSENEARELGGLLEAMDHFKLESGILVTYEQQFERKEQGKDVLVVPILEWLMQDIKVFFPNPVH